MDFHEIDTKGKLWIQRVSSLPTWTAADTGRVLYVTGTDAFYFGSASAWELWGSDIIPAGTKMIFYQNTAPDGWTIDGTVADALIGVKGGTQSYNVNAGQLAGTWTQTNHTHTFSDSFSASHQHGMDHNHYVADYNSGIDRQYLFNGAGEAKTISQLGYSRGHFGTNSFGYVTGVTSGDPKYDRGDFFTSLVSRSGTTGTGTTDSADASGTVSGTTSNNSSVSNWRPYAAVCIVATKD
jgi:hypothetical protein